MPRNYVHLQECKVQSAKAVIIIGPTLAAESASEDIQRYYNNNYSNIFNYNFLVNRYSSNVIQSDRHSIITSLNVHTLIENAFKSNENNLITRNNKYIFTLIEIVYDSNIYFLRLPKMNPSEINKNMQQENNNKSKNIDLDIIASGSVLSHSLIEGLIIQVFF